MITLDWPFLVECPINNAVSSIVKTYRMHSFSPQMVLNPVLAEVGKRCNAALTIGLLLPSPNARCGDVLRGATTPIVLDRDCCLNI